jgi:2-oxoglutarate ferredoxin oxidoreductase subunit gamma
MTKDIIMAGFGGQGILMIGNLLALTAMEEGKNVTYLPSYGVEMRGGTANCTVIISDEEIGSPVVWRPGSLVIMNGPSLERFLPNLQPGGELVINSSWWTLGKWAGPTSGSSRSRRTRSPGTRSAAGRWPR